MYHVHLGDSECISFNKDDSSNTGTYNIITRDHSAESLEEFKRIIDNYEKEKEAYLCMMSLHILKRNLLYFQ